MYRVNLVKNYLTNVDEVLALVEAHSDKFSSREETAPNKFITRYGSSKMKSLFSINMSTELMDAIFKTIPDDRRFVDSVTINRYDPGDYLARHRDSQGFYWKFKLIFLTSDKPHFKWYDENNVGHLVEEEPGAYLEMPIHVEHEVTKIEETESPKYSLVLTWGRL